MNFDVALFDLDGTLIDGRDGIIDSIRAALGTLGLKRDLDSLASLIGPPLQEIFASLGVEAHHIPSVVDAYRVHYEAGAIRNNRPFAEIDDTLGALHSAGVRLAICTSKPWRYAEKIVEQHGWGDTFLVVSGPEMDGTRRHKPEILAHALARLGEPQRKRVVMIGDRHYDITGAHAVDVASIGVTWGFGSRDELTTAGAGTIVDEPRVLLDAVLGLGG